MVSNYAYNFFQKSLKEFGTIRIYCVFNFKCISTKKKKIEGGIEDGTYEEKSYEKFIYSQNIGRDDFSTFEEFRKYLLEGAIDVFQTMQKKDYVIAYGIGDIDINVLKYNPLEWSGSSYAKLPKIIFDSKGVINIQNTDNKCFLYSLIASRHPVINHAERVSHYQKDDYLKEFDFKETDFPMQLNKIIYFEKKNNIRIHVYGVDETEKTRITLYRSKSLNTETVNLFYFNNHYTLIKNWSRFSGNSKEHVCPNCFWRYSNLNCFNNHLKLCELLNPEGNNHIMPADKVLVNKKTGEETIKKSQTSFNDFKKQKKVPVILYADFETCLVPFVSNPDKTIKNNIHNKEGVVAIHKANSFRVFIESIIDLDMPLDYTYYGEDVDIHFVDLLVNQLESKIQLKLEEATHKYPKPILTKQEENDFQKSKLCLFCNKELFRDKVRDHCHFTGKYAGASHQFCNLKAHQRFKGKTTIPVVFHNANYDIKCFMSAFQKLKGEDCFVKNISGIPCNMEVYKSLNINSFSIIDSYAHLSLSLDSLIKNLPSEKKVLLKTIAKTEEGFNLISKKGFYPYEIITSNDKLHFPIEELKQSHFDNKLTLSKISNEDYAHVLKVINYFKITTFKEYHDLYLKIDVFGLRDVFEYHRELTFKSYGLDAGHYIGLPQLTWNAGLKFDKTYLDDLTDMEMFLLFEKQKRGGVSVISHKYAKANNHYLPDYDKSQIDSYLMQLDCNNLYGKSMSEKLPISNFKWCEIDENFVKNYNYETNNKGYTLEVDLEYPDSLHELHNDFPLAPEHLILDKHEKLTPNFLPKTEYVVHIANLKYYLEKGLILKKIHRVVEYTHSNWLAKYINFNTALRQKATNDFEKDFYKLMNNAFYGKTMENVRGRVNVQFCFTKKQFLKHTGSPIFANQINVINEDGLALVKTHKRLIKLNKPIYIGATVLDLSKLLMFKFHYDVMKVQFPNALMMKTDTDSLLYYIETHDLYEEFKTPLIQKHLEFSNYPKNHTLFNNDRKKVMGLFQDESVDNHMVIISEYIGLRAKSYSNLLWNTAEQTYENKMKSKGTSKNHLKKRFDFEDFKDCLTNKKTISIGKNAIKDKHKEKILSFISHNLQMYTVEQSKIVLSCNDNKRIPMEHNNLMTYAIGHYKTK
jgi:hypothetical protein